MPSSLPPLDSAIAATLLADRHRFRQQLRGLRQAEKEGRPFDRNLSRLQEQIQRSARLRQERLDRRPANIRFDDDLPISARRNEIAAAIREHQVVIVCGETGSGKSTQLPKICLELGRGIDGVIGHSQPRRIAARSVATRVAEELGVSLGGAVGYKVRFSDETGPHTLVKLLTDGMLLAESQKDRYFSQYDTLIIDEAHERSLNIDFLLGCIQRILPKRPELRLIITSATIDSQRFSEHFRTPRGPAPVIEVSGRTYPVDVRYRPPLPDETGDEPDFPDSIFAALEEISQDEPGDVLIFLPTEHAIHETAKHLRSRPLPGDRGRTTEILPLYARLSAKEQQRVFEPHAHRRIVLATNVAESSLTVPGIRAVIDTGAARISRYSARSKVQRLPIEAVSQASANQRAGRCGRIGPGICVRLYSEEDYQGRETYTQPEIQRTNLAAVILQAKALSLGEIEDFPFLDPPKPEAIRDGYKTLYELGAIDHPPLRARADSNAEGRDRETERPEGRSPGNGSGGPPERKPPAGDAKLFALHSTPPPEPSEAAGRSHRPARPGIPTGAAAALTPIGRQLARLPVDPRIGRMILAARDERCLDEVLIMAAALEIQDPRERPLDKQQQADEAHARFANETSDFLSYLSLWEFYHGLKEKLSRNQLKKACQQNFLSPTRMWEWVDVHRQLVEIVTQEGWRAAPGLGRSSLPSRPPALPPSPTKPDSAAIHRALLTGLLSNIAQLSDAGGEATSDAKPGRSKASPGEYTVAGGGKFVLWPGSGVAAKKPKWVVAAELVETTRRYLRCVSRIDPAWIEPLARHLVTLSHSDPVWVRETASVMANEKVSLAGLTIVPRRRVRYGPIDPVKSRELFLQHALVEADFDTSGTFLAENRKLVESLKDLQKKTRRYDFVPEDQAIYDFYDRRIPAEVFDGQRFEKWRRDAERGNPAVLRMTRDDLLTAAEEEVSAEAFPDQLFLRQMEAPLEYRYEPGSAGDGVTLTIPREALNQLDAQRLGWLVPGLLEEKIAAMIKSLPKDLRRHFVPVPETAKSVLRQLKFGEGDLSASVAEVLRKISGEPIPVQAFALGELPDHLRMNIRVVDPKGEAVAADRDLQGLRQKLGAEASASFTAAETGKWNRDGVTEWDFDTLPDTVDVVRGNLLLKGYPAVIDAGESVSLRLVDCPNKAAFLSRAGMRRLFALTAKRDLKTQVDWLPDLNRLMLISATFASYPLPTELRWIPHAPIPPDALPAGTADRRESSDRKSSGLARSAPTRPSGTAAGARGEPKPSGGTPTSTPMTDFRQQLSDLIADRAFFEKPELPQTAHQFKERVKLGRNRISVAVQDVSVAIGPILTGFQEARKALESLPKQAPAPGKPGAAFRTDPGTMKAIADDVRLQLALLIEPGFLAQTRWEWLNQYPRYFKGIVHRLGKLNGDGLARDRKADAAFQVRWRQYLERMRDHRQRDLHDPALVHYRWMLEEFRVSLFAQPLGTGIPVSERRLEEQWAKVRA